MRTIVHLSDIHFGKVDRNLIRPLIEAVHEIRPDLIVVSGDLTQRALRREYHAAREFLLALPGPQIVVPGNHDIPIWNPVARFAKPLALFKHFVTDNLFPFYEDEEIAAIGINTARSSTTKYGHISRRQLSIIREMLCPVSSERIKIVVTHHPFDLPEGYHNKRQIVSKSRRAMAVLAECGADLFLAGHLHRGFIRHTAERYKIENYAALIVQAGTATSWRSSQEMNSFNIIRCHDNCVEISRMVVTADSHVFTANEPERFEHIEGTGWQRMRD